MVIKVSRLVVIRVILLDIINYMVLSRAFFNFRRAASLYYWKINSDFWVFFSRLHVTHYSSY